LFDTKTDQAKPSVRFQSCVFAQDWDGIKFEHTLCTATNSRCDENQEYVHLLLLHKIATGMNLIRLDSKNTNDKETIAKQDNL
jgi:hypothetical protein